ncbi:MAG: hypothetical protein HC829_05115 [Bacteroidales bacterium]|nr:hypothetical protein [Bacteroidales bacterium]
MRDPATLEPLGRPWHINGRQPVHIATGGYEYPIYETFADGLMLARTMEGIRCYDLRQP